MIVDVFIPCTIDQFYPNVGKNTIKLLEQVGCKVLYNAEQTCCGKAAYESGNWKEAKKTASKFLSTFSGNNPIICPSDACISFIKNHYKTIFHNTSNHIVYQRLSSNIYEFSDFVYHQLHATDFGAVFPHKVAWHDSCSAQQLNKQENVSRKLLSKVKDLELIEIDDIQNCCGVGGMLPIFHQDMAMAMVKHKIEQALQTEAEYIALTDMACLMFMEQYIKKEKINLKVIHIVDILSSKE